MPAPKKNKNAQRGNNPATSHIHLRVTPAEKAQIVHDADGKKLSTHIRQKLGLKT